jgi:crotonobetainyl-CoA:carnitine CoA-transferase CaiB-like acyl-CoA transferase
VLTARTHAERDPGERLVDISVVAAGGRLRRKDGRHIQQLPAVGQLHQTGLPYRFSESPGVLHLPPPLLGQHTDDVLQALGYAKAEIGRLRRAGVI